jgi:hypothetical protein
MHSDPLSLPLGHLFYLFLLLAFHFPELYYSSDAFSPLCMVTLQHKYRILFILAVCFAVFPPILIFDVPLALPSFIYDAIEAKKRVEVT